MSGRLHLIFPCVAFILAVILGFIYAVTGFQIPTGGFVQVIAVGGLSAFSSFFSTLTGYVQAYVHPQQPVQNMYAKLYGYNTGYQTLSMISDLKLGTILFFW